MNHFKIPKDAYPLILYQRTQYMKSQGFPRLYRRLVKTLSFEKLVSLESLFFKKHIAGCYFEDMQREIETLKPHLPATPGAILDIGCGMAGIDVFLSAHYQHRCNIYLLDKSHVEDEVFYHFESRGAFYNSLALAGEFLRDNGVPAENIFSQEATDDSQILFDQVQFSLVLSLISWGYHYPVSTYLNQVHSRLAADGRLILDVRKGNDQKLEIERLFGNATVILEDAKSERILAIKQQG